MGYQRSYDCGTIAIAASSTNSGALAADPHFQNADALLIEAPDTLTGTITVQVSLDGGSSYSDLQSGGADITIAAASVMLINPLGFTHLRVQSGSAEASERTFTVRAIETISQIRTRRAR